MKTLAAIGLLLFTAATSIDVKSNQRLSVKVSPAVAIAPAMLTIRATVEPDDNNRALEISVGSDGYERISEVPLEGKNSQRVTVVELRGIPTGFYEVRATLVGTAGQIASDLQLVNVQPSPGYSR